VPRGRALAGKPPRSEVAILAPRSAEVWDAKDIATPNQIQDATNNDLNRHTVDYMAEVFDLYLALQHANIPWSSWTRTTCRPWD